MKDWTEDLRSFGRGGCKEIRQLMRQLHRDGGWRARWGGTGHIVLQRIDTGEMVTAPATPSDDRSIRNTRARIRRIAEGREGSR